MARRLDCDVALTLADVHETWSCEDEDVDYRRHRGKYYDNDDDDSSRGADDGTPALLELNDSEVELRHVVDADGKVGIASGYVLDSELCYTKPSVDLDPFRSEHEGYMGNWGNTVDRWYHRAAVVLWPRERAFLIRAKMSASFALDELARMVKSGPLELATRHAEQLAPFWANVWHRADDGRLVGKTLRLALALDSPELALSLVSPMRVEHLTSGVARVFVELLERYGSEWTKQVLTAWRSAARSNLDEGRLPWLSSIHELTASLTTANSASAGAFAQRLVAEQWEWLAERHRSTLEIGPTGVLNMLARLTNPTLRLIESTVALGNERLHAEISALLSAPEYPVLAVVHLLEVAQRMHATHDLDTLNLGSVGVHCITELERRLAVPARANDDWSVASPWRCSCALCKQLSPFLAARDRTRLEWPLAKDKRAHIHGILDRFDLPVAHATRRTGSPYTLVLVKTRDIFERDAAERDACRRGLLVLSGKPLPPRGESDSRSRSPATGVLRQPRSK